MKKTDKPIVVEQAFSTTNKQLWNAITNADKMKLWFFDNIPDFKAEVGFETRFPVQSEERTFTHLWKVTEVVPFKKITYNWKYEEYGGDSFVTFKLSEIKDGVKLTLSMDVVEDFPEGIPEFTRESCIGGWYYFIGERLKKYFE